MASEEMDMEYEDDGYIELVLKVLGLMCDGQNTQLQVSCTKLNIIEELSHVTKTLIGISFTTEPYVLWATLLLKISCKQIITDIIDY